MDNVLTPTELIFFNKLSEFFNIEYLGNFVGRSNYRSAMNSLRFMMSNVLLKGKTNLTVAYQVVLNDRDNKYPDFLLSDGFKTLRVEIKNFESERMIAREVNSIDRIKDDAFWFVTFNKDVRKIEREATKRNSKIKILSYDDNLFLEIKSFFS